MIGNSLQNERQIGLKLQQQAISYSINERIHKKLEKS